MLLRLPASGAVRRGAIAALIAMSMVFIFGMVAFSVDVSYIMLVRNRLQVAADAAALAAAANLGNTTTATAKAKAIAAANVAGGPSDFVSLADSDILYGNWNTTTRVWTVNGTPRNAVRVTARRNALPLFFAPVIGVPTWDVRASTETTAVTTPRDIVFVLDLSGSMNNDTEIWATNAINGAFTGYPTIGTDSMQAVFTDFGYGTYPGTVQHIGQGYIPSGQQNNNAYNYLANTFLLNNSTYGTAYKVLSGDNAAARKTKTYKFLIDIQMAALMPNATPALNSSTNYNYWADYIDYVLYSNVSGQPPSQASNDVTGLSNPYPDAWPDLDSSTISGFRNKLGYQTYVQYMMDLGRNLTSGGSLTPLSASSSNCPWRLETDTTSAGYGLQFPPREQPTHAMRVAVMAAINSISAQNVGIAGTLKDHIGIVTFDTIAGSVAQVSLSASDCDYAACKSALRSLQAVGDDQLSTGSEKGLQMAYNMIDPSQNSNARSSSTKMVVFLSDGIANLKTSSNSTIDNYVSSNGSAAEWFNSGSSYHRERNGALMQTNMIAGRGWSTYSIGMGLGCDRTLMDKMARCAGTGQEDPSNPTGPKISPYASGNPADYQSRLTSIFDNIVSHSNVSLVK